MKATLIFKLPEEQEEFRLAQSGSSYNIVLSEIAEHLRSKLKYGELTPEQDACYEELREKLHSLLKEYDVSI